MQHHPTSDEETDYQKKETPNPIPKDETRDRADKATDFGNGSKRGQE